MRINPELLAALNSLTDALQADRVRDPEKFFGSPEEKLLQELFVARHVYVSACEELEHYEHKIDLPRRRLPSPAKLNRCLGN
jgi:hypothetical protein